jgi:Xaa-Pro aminopeptidase
MSAPGPGTGSGAGDAPPAPGTDYAFLRAAVDEAGADAFVHVGDRFDDGLRYLTRLAGPDRDYAFVFVDGTSTLCAPALFGEQAAREFPGDEVRTEALSDPAGVRAAAVLDDALEGAGTVLVPRRLPHDAAVYLEDAGHDLVSTDAVDRARQRKSDAELACLRFTQRAALRGMARAEAVLAEAVPDGDALRWEGAPLTTERLRREVNAAIAAAGARDAGNSVVGAGATCADLHFTGDDDVAPGETVLLDLSPRGPRGYYGDVTRTFVVGDDGWGRRAYVAVEAAREAALEQVEAGTPARRVHEEAAAELAAFGFAVDSSERGFTHGVGHGVGVSLHEGPSLRADDPLEPGHVVTIEPGVYDPGRGGVRLEDLVVVTADGYEILAEYPLSSTPQERR